LSIFEIYLQISILLSSVLVSGFFFCT